MPLFPVNGRPVVPAVQLQRLGIECQLVSSACFVAEPACDEITTVLFLFALDDHSTGHQSLDCVIQPLVIALPALRPRAFRNAYPVNWQVWPRGSSRARCTACSHTSRSDWSSCCPVKLTEIPSSEPRTSFFIHLRVLPWIAAKRAERRKLFGVPLRGSGQSGNWITFAGSCGSGAGGAALIFAPRLSYILASTGSGCESIGCGSLIRALPSRSYRLPGLW